jgi:parallel beta-helix repeat protein
MPRIRPLLIAALLVLSVLTVGPVAFAGSNTAAPTAVDSCRVIDEPGQYELTQDIQVDEGLQPHCIKITSSNVSFDGNGHTIQGNYTRHKEYREHDALTLDPKAAVLVSGNDTLSNVTVSNLTADDWKTGVKFADTTASSLEGYTAKQSAFMGLWLENFDAGTVADSTAAETQGSALRFSGNDTLVQGNNLSNNAGAAISWTGAGLYVDGTNNTVADNRIVDNADAGEITGRALTVANNTVSNEDELLIETEGGAVVGNEITRTRDYQESGLKVDGSDVLVARNSFDGENVGMVVNGSEYTIVENQLDGGVIETLQFSEEGLYDSVVARNTIDHGSISVNGALDQERSNVTIAENDITNGDIIVWVPYATIRDNTVSGSDRDNGVTDAGITVYGNSNGTMVVGNTVTNNTDGILIQSSSPVPVTIRENVIRNNTDGIHITNQSATSGGDGGECTIGSAIDGTVYVEIHENTIAGNSEYGVNNEDETTVNATQNYWGTADGPSSVSSDADAPFEDPETGTPADGSGDAVSEGSTAGVSNVHFDEALTESPV